MNQNFDLCNVFNIEQWETLQNSLATTTKMAIITVDYKGHPITCHSGCCDFCRIIREDEVLSQFCQKCDSIGGLESVRTNSPYIYKCYFSIIDVAIPITVNNQYAGAIMAGQVRLSAAEDAASLVEQIYLPSSQKYMKDKKASLAKEYSRIPVLPYSQIAMVSKMLFDLCNYIVSPAGPPKHLAVPSPIYTAPEANGNHGLLAYTDTLNPIILNVLNYLNTHRQDSPALDKMALHCNVSTGYLSRLFSKEVGESYTSFCSRLKIEWAKELLENTGKTVTEISNELGFGDPGYFIKIFKKYSSLTPAAYRSYLR